MAGIAPGTVEKASGCVSPLTGKLFEIGDVLGYFLLSWAAASLGADERSARGSLTTPGNR